MRPEPPGDDVVVDSLTGGPGVRRGIAGGSRG